MALAGFDESYYLAAKLADLQAASDDYADWTVDDVAAAFADAGLTAEEHYQTYGWEEGLAPNAYFDADEYKAAKADALVAGDDGSTYPDRATALAAFEAAWTEDPYLHYLAYGDSEGVNPSNAFDSDQYYADKLAALQADEGTAADWADKTVDDLKAYFEDLGLSAVEHFILYGEDEGLTAPEVSDPVDPDANPGETYTLTTGVDTITGTSADDDFVGVVSSLSSTGTLNAADVLDGGEGSDTLTVDLQGNFTGLSSDGSISNIETIALTNETSISRTFDASNISGVEKYSIDSQKAVSLSDLAAAGIEVAYANVQSDVSIAFDSSLDLTGSSDAMSLTFDGVGAAKVLNADGTVKTAENDVKVTMASIEDLSVATENNGSFIDLSAADAASYTITGDQDLTISAVKNGLTTVDASDFTGALTINTTGVTTANSLDTISTGSGDDTVTVDAADVVANAAISGGDGDDTLKLDDSAGSTVQFAMSDVETVRFTGVATGQTLIFSAKDVAGLTTLQLDADSTDNGAVTAVNLGSSDITLNTSGDVDGGQDISVDSSGSVTINMDASAAGGAVAAKTTGAAYAGSETPDQDITLANAGAVIVNVNDYIDFTGLVDAANATDVTVNVASAKNSATTPVEMTRFNGDLDVAKATTLTINAEGGFTAGAASDVSAAQVVTIDTDNTVDFNSNSIDLAAAATVTLSGSNKNSAVTLDSIGTDDTTDVDYAVTVEATGLKSGLTIDNIESQESVTVDLEGVTGSVNIDDLVGSNVTISAPNSVKDITIDDIDSTTANTGAATLTLTDAADTLNVGNIGGLTAFKTAEIDFTGALDNVVVGTITAKTVTVDAENALGTVTIGAAAAGATGSGDITITDALTYTAGINGANSATAALDIDTSTTAEDATITLNGNIGDDQFNIAVQDTDTTAAGETASLSVTVTGDLDIGTNDVTVDASGVADDDGATATGGATLDLSGLTASGTTTITVTGSANDDTIKAAKVDTTIEGGVGEDTITGGAGDDFITGGDDADTLTGGAGDDIFNYTAAADSATATGVDDIVDFGTSGTDQIAFDADATAVFLNDSNNVLAIVGSATTTTGNTLQKMASVAKSTATSIASGSALDAFFVYSASASATTNASGALAAFKAFDFGAKAASVTSAGTSDIVVAFALNASGTELYVLQGKVTTSASVLGVVDGTAAIIMTIGIDSAPAAGDIIVY